MASKNHEEPKPKATDRKPAWELVVRYTDENYEDVDELLADMRERDKIGRERYGVPLTGANGRSQLVDMYQEMLDATVYARAWLDEQNLDPDGLRQSTTKRELNEREQLVLGLFRDLVDALTELREVI